MFILHVDLTAKPGFAENLTSTCQDFLYPAISRQPGFVEARLLLAKSPGTRTHRLVIAFENEELQKRWANSDVHREVWAKLEPSIGKLSGDVFDEPAGIRKVGDN